MPSTSRCATGRTTHGAAAPIPTSSSTCDATNAEAVLRSGLADIRFACSELSPSFPGYIEGAIVAGREAAAEVVARLAGSLPAG